MIESTLRFDYEDIPGLLPILWAVQRSCIRSREQSGRWPGNKATVKEQGVVTPTGTAVTAKTRVKKFWPSFLLFDCTRKRFFMIWSYSKSANDHWLHTSFPLTKQYTEESEPTPTVLSTRCLVTAVTRSDHPLRKGSFGYLHLMSNSLIVICSWEHAVCGDQGVSAEEHYCLSNHLNKLSGARKHTLGPTDLQSPHHRVS